MTELPTLPDPQSVADTLNRMKDSVLAHYRRFDQDIAEARKMIEDAEAEQAKLREAYPLFLGSTKPRANKKKGEPTAEVKNRVLRTIAEHPDKTRTQLSGYLNFSASWISRCIAVINEGVSPPVPLIDVMKGGREHRYRLTAAGHTFLDRGGYRAESNA